MTDHRSPCPDTPSCDESISHIRIGTGECLGSAWRIAAKEEDCPVHRIGKRSAEDQFAASVSLPGQCEVLGSIRGPVLDIVRHDIVNEQIMHDDYSDPVPPAGVTTRGGGPTSAVPSLGFTPEVVACGDGVVPFVDLSSQPATSTTTNTAVAAKLLII
jgi:hypothetical protein